MIHAPMSRIADKSVMVYICLVRTPLFFLIHVPSTQAQVTTIRPTTYNSQTIAFEES